MVAVDREFRGMEHRRENSGVPANLSPRLQSVGKGCRICDKNNGYSEEMPVFTAIIRKSDVGTGIAKKRFRGLHPASNAGEKRWWN